MSKLQRHPQYIYHLILKTEVNLAFNTIRPVLAMQNTCKSRYSPGRK